MLLYFPFNTDIYLHTSIAPLDDELSQTPNPVQSFQMSTGNHIEEANAYMNPENGTVISVYGHADFNNYVKIEWKLYASDPTGERRRAGALINEGVAGYQGGEKEPVTEIFLYTGPNDPSFAVLHSGAARDFWVEYDAFLKDPDTDAFTVRIEIGSLYLSSLVTPTPTHAPTTAFPTETPTLGVVTNAPTLSPVHEHHHDADEVDGLVGTGWASANTVLTVLSLIITILLVIYVCVVQPNQQSDAMVGAPSNTGVQMSSGATTGAGEI